MEGNIRIIQTAQGMWYGPVEMLLPELEAREISVSRSVSWPKGSLSILILPSISVTESDTHNVNAQKFSSKIMVNYYYFVCLNFHKKSPILPERAKVLKNHIKNPVSRENHWPVASRWQILSHNVVSSTRTGFELTTLVVIGTDCTCSCKSNYHAIMTTASPSKYRRETRTSEAYLM